MQKDALRISRQHGLRRRTDWFGPQSFDAKKRDPEILPITGQTARRHRESTEARAPAYKICGIMYFGIRHELAGKGWHNADCDEISRPRVTAIWLVTWAKHNTSRRFAVANA